MRIGIIGAKGQAGKAIVEESRKRGLEVTAIVRNGNGISDVAILEKDILSLTKEDVKDFDVVVNATGYWREEDLHMHTDGTVHLAKLLKGSDIRLVVVGGAGSLYVDENHSTTLADLPEFPIEYKPVADAMRAGLDRLRNFSDVAWTYISPAADFDAKGKYTGEYLIGGEEYFENDKKESYISYTDYAKALVDEVINGKYIRRRISVVGR